MSAFVFGQDAPCRACHGAGERVVKMTPQEQRERNRQLRREKHKNSGPVDRVSPLKTCPDCQGRGYVPIAVADRRTDR